LARVEQEAMGPETKRLMKELIKYESVGHLYWAVFRCPPVLKSGKGATLTDVDGNNFVDFMGGFGVHNAGLSHPDIVKAIKEQAERLNHIACAAGLAMINVLQRDKVPEHAASVGEHLLRRLRDMQEEHPLLGDANGKGLFVGIEFVRSRDTKEPANKEAEWIQRQCVHKGLLIQRAGYFANRFNIYPPLSLTKEEADKGVDILEELIRDAEREFNIR